MPGLALFDHRLLVVTGKGGVGKSTISAALALDATRRGKRVLVCEVNARERVAPLLGSQPSGSTIREAAPGLFTVNVTPRAAMREYGLIVLKFKTIYDAVFENRVVHYFLRVIPSLAELVMLGKILSEVRGDPRLHRQWDLVVLDAPATGHALQLLRVPQALLDTVPAGPLRRDAEWMHALLVDAAVTSLLIVTLPEEMPVNEAIDLDGEVRRTLGIARGALIMNAMPEARFSTEERAALGELRGDPAPLGPAAAAGHLQATRAELAARYLAQARAGIGLPTVVVPQLARDEWDRSAVDAVAAVLQRSL